MEDDIQVSDWIPGGAVWLFRTGEDLQRKETGRECSGRTPRAPSWTLCELSVKFRKETAGGGGKKNMKTAYGPS